MTIHISDFVLYYLVYIVVWWACARYVFVPIINKLWQDSKEKKSGNFMRSTVPTWPAHLALALWGPLGWVMLVYDKIDDQRSKKRWEKIRENSKPNY